MSTKPIAINADPTEPEYSAVETRRSLAMLLNHGVTDGLGARAGVRPGGSDALTLAGTTINVNARPVVVYPGESSTDGPYIGHLMPDTHTLDPADGSNPRIDIVIVRVYDDDHDASGRRELVTEYIAGTPAADPDPPATPSGAWVGLEVLVPAGGSPSPSATYVAPYAVASGGVLPVRDNTEGPDAGRYHGMVRYRQDTDELEAWDGSAWQPIAAPNGWTRITSGAAGPVSQVSIDLTGGGRFPAGTFDTIKVFADGYVDGTSILGARLNGVTDGNYNRTQVIIDATGGGGFASSNAADNSTQWLVGEWGTGTRQNALELTLLHAAADSQMSMLFHAVNTGAGTIGIGGGGYGNVDILPASLQLRVASGGTSFTGITWYALGLRA